MNVVSYLDREGVQYKLLHHRRTYTAQDLAAAEHVSGWNVIKPVLVKADERLMLCALPAAQRIDLDRLKQVLHARKVELADEPTLGRVFADCELGAEPPIGSLFGVETIMERSVEEADRVIFQVGTHSEAVEMPLSDYKRLARPHVASFGRP
ncbi:MAG: deacylase [Phycisphaerae bacterium]|nr:deacylase [Phycisphaerae bacterium]MDW8261683.1 YbaK/EbsC family protein [Phycisphaerales bacterium]